MRRVDSVFVSSFSREFLPALSPLRMTFLFIHFYLLWRHARLSVVRLSYASLFYFHVNFSSTYLSLARGYNGLTQTGRLRLVTSITET